MRFFADGPSIPDDLLEQRDQGNVVFLCGAGISMPAGLPSFWRLTKDVMRQLGTPADAPSRQLLDQPGAAPQLDRVFNLLCEEYRRDEVDRAVSRILRTPRRANVLHHQTILRISRNARRQPQVVTTNFDLLFKRADPTLRTHVSPALPNVASLGSFNGLVYLHGRLVDGRQADDPHHLVLTSGDFGRAYLADGWATAFIRDLLNAYIIVLVGYSASDPPVRYLLEGLHSQQHNSSKQIFAFDQGEEDIVFSRWRPLGVRAIPYGPCADLQHAVLWNTLAAWAHRADDVENWRRSIVSLAQRNPRDLDSCQRGQVASLASTAIGAANFADATPPPPAEWLCVLDRRVRYADPKERVGPDTVDPLLIYGLDDDPDRNDSGQDKDSSPALADDLIGLSPSDERTDVFKRLGGAFADTRLPERLEHLARWFGRVADEPVAIWWAIGYQSLHARLLHSAEWALRYRRTDLHEAGRRAWPLLLECFQRDRNDDLNWHHLADRLQVDGWTTQTLRAFEAVIKPYLRAKRHYEHRVFPPDASSIDATPRSLIDFDVVFLKRHGQDPAIDSAVLPDVFRCVRRGLEHGSDLLSEIDTRYWRTSSFHPGSGEHYLDEPSEYFMWARELFDRLALENPEVARQEVRRWRGGDEFFFDKFRIYAWMITGLISADEVAERLVALSPLSFWNTSHRRELLHTLTARWREFTSDDRGRIEALILAGSPDDTEQDDQPSLKVTRAVRMLGWLQQRGCELTSNTVDALVFLRSTISGWTESFDEHADDSLEITGGWVRTNSDPSDLVNSPLNQLASLAVEKTVEPFGELTRYAPFEGLVEKAPRKALSALSYEARRGRHPLVLWRALLAHWPKDARHRLLVAIAERLTRLPLEVRRSIHYDLSHWYRDNGPRLAQASPNSAFRLFDVLVDTLIAKGDEGTRSGIGEVTQGGRVILRSRRTQEHAINSPTGHLTAAMVQIFDDRKPPPGSGLPDEFRVRFERLLGLGGDGTDYAVSELVLQLRWLYTIDPDWTRLHLVPLLSPGSQLAEPAWNAVLWGQPIGQFDLFRQIKPSFLAIFQIATAWHWDRDAGHSLEKHLLAYCYWKHKGRRYVTFDECRVALRSVDDSARAYAIRFLSQAFREDADWWRTFAKPFLQKAWPHEARFQTEAVSDALTYLALEADQHFPDVVDTIMPLLVPVSRLDMTVHRAIHSTGTPIPSRFPDETLRLLDALMPTQPAFVPHALDAALEAVVAAAPHLRSDLRWQRLNDIARRR